MPAVHPVRGQGVRVLGIVAAIFLFFIIIFRSGRSTSHAVNSEAVPFDELRLTGHHYPPMSQAHAACNSHGLSVYTKTRRRVYDLVLFSSELDWLMVRLLTLADHVDYFIIVESATTFSGKTKPLYLKDNWGQFKEYHDKIIYRVVEDTATSMNIWDHESFLRNSLLYAVFPSLEGHVSEPREGDALIVSDIDEIVRPETAVILRYCDIPSRLNLRSRFYYYAFEWLHRGEEWAHPQATVYTGNVATTISPEALRMNHLGPGWSLFAAVNRWRDQATLTNASWHCSFCFDSISSVHRKMESFSHQDLNTDSNRDPRTIIDRFKHGIDLFERPNEIYDHVEHNRDMPKRVYLLAMYADEYTYMVNRSNVYGRFTDAKALLEHT